MDTVGISVRSKINQETLKCCLEPLDFFLSIIIGANGNGLGRRLHVVLNGWHLGGPRLAVVYVAHCLAIRHSRPHFIGHVDLSHGARRNMIIVLLRLLEERPLFLNKALVVLSEGL